jgi:CSLREA domain-containing protein
LLALAGLGWLLWQPLQGQAAPAQPVAPTPGVSAIIVTTLEDEDNTDGDCSLREALSAANFDQARDACPAGSGKDTIDFRGFITTRDVVTISLGSPLVISTSLDILGPGADQLQISGGGVTQILQIGPLAVVSIQDLSLVSGYSDMQDGGAIDNQGTLGVLRVLFSGNQALGNGGAIASGSLLAVSNSTFYDNQASLNGGGIYNIDGQAVVQNSTFVANRASTGTFNNYGGGAICSMSEDDPAELVLSHSTLSANSAHLGGGLSNFDGTLTVHHTILDGNTVDATGEGPNCYSSELPAGDYNLESGTDCAFSGTGNLQSAQAGLYSLGMYGGALPTQTLAPWSQAREAGDPAFAPPPLYDQRGAPFKRVIGARIDIGAIEGWYWLFTPLLVE